MRPTVAPPAELVTVIVVGLGNSGSHVVSHLARLVEVGRLVLIDPDTYGESNRRSQSIGCDDIGRAKADVQAALARRINPGLAVSGLAESVEDVPLGWLRGELICACLDSRSARQYVNESARKLGVPWIDAGVEPGNWLARVNVYEPGREAPCLECAWDQRDYDALPQRYPCASIEPGPATAAPSSLGALAASLQAVEGQKLLSGRKADAVVGAQVLIDARTYHLYRTMMRRNPTCRLSHDDPIEITPVDSTVGQLTVPDMLALTLDAGTGGSSDVGLEVPMHSWASRQLCMECGRATDGPRLQRSLARCTACDGPVTASGFDLFDELAGDLVAPAGAPPTLEVLGLRNHDVVGIGQPGHRRYVELGATPTGEQHR